MKRRFFAITAALLVLLAVIVVPSGLKAGASTAPLYESLIKVTGYTVSDDASKIGSVPKFTIKVEFPILVQDDDADGVYGMNNITVSQLKSFEVSIGTGSVFDFPYGQASIMPFSDPETYPGLNATTAEFQLSLVNKNGTGNLVLELSHISKTVPGPVDDIRAKSSRSIYIMESIYIEPPTQPYEPPYEPPAPDYGATPRLTVTGDLPSLQAGRSGGVKFTLTNNSSHIAYSVYVSILDGSNDLFRPLTISGSLISVGTIRNGTSNSSNVTIPVDVFEDVKEGYYTITLRITMTNSAGSTVEQNDSIQVFISNPKTGASAGKPSLSVASATVDKNTPGGDGLITFSLTIANIGDGTASETRVSLTGFRSSEITLNESLVTKSLDSIDAGGSATAKYSLRVDKSLESGSYPLNVEVRYKLPDGTEGSMTDVAYINIIRPASSQSTVQLTGISQDVSNPGRSNTINVTLTIQNKGDTEAQDVSVGFAGLSSSSFTLSGDFGERELGNITPGGAVTTTIALYVSESLPNGNYPLSVLVKYSDPGAAGSQLNSVETDIYIFVSRPEKDEKDSDDVDNSVPRVIISKHSISVDTVVAGGPFELNVTLLNTSTKKNVMNMKVTVTDKDGIFIPVEGVNSFYIAELPIGQTTDISIILTPKPDAETKSFPVSISLDYEDEKNAPYSVTESLSIPVYQPQRLEVMNVNFYDEGNGMAYLNFQFVNKGKSPLYNMNIRMDGPMSAMEGDYLVGTFGPGQADYFEDTIIPQLYGELSGEIVLEYEDSSGAQQELRYPLFAYINEPYQPDPGFPGDIFPGGPEWPYDGMGFEEEGGGMPTWQILSIVGGVVVIGAITTAIIVKKAKRKKIELEDYE